MTRTVFSSQLSDDRRSVAEARNQEFSRIHGLSAWNQSSKLHHDFISFLAVAQWHELDFLGLTWQPALQRVGRGATAHIHQSQINPQTSFAFKRIAPSTFEADERKVYRALISELLVLGHSVIKELENIVKLIGICSDTSGTCDEDYKVWPVLVYEKADFGDLGQFMDTEAGKGLTFDQRLHMCVGIGNALMVMHSCSVVHGDIKPQNVLIFRQGTDGYLAKVADFGFSASSSTEDCVTVPKTTPWNSPEWHRRGFTISQVKKMDVYSFGMLCLWLLFLDIFPIHRSSVSVLEQWAGDDLFSQRAEHCIGETFLETLKSEDKMLRLANQLLSIKSDLDQDQRDRLGKFFLCLAHDPNDRNVDLFALLGLLCSKQITPPPLTEFFESDDYLPLPFQITKNFRNLMDVDYRTRKHIFRCLRIQGTDYECEFCRNSAAFQTSFCYYVGFGTPRNERKARLWLSNEHSMNEIENALEVVRDQGFSFSERMMQLMDGGFDLQFDEVTEYQQAQILDLSGAEYAREIEDMSWVFGRTHIVVTRQKFILVAILVASDEYEKAKTLAVEIEAQLRNDPEYGPEHHLTLDAVTLLAYIFMQLGDNKKAETLCMQARSGFERTVGHQHPSTLHALSQLATITRYQGNYERAEILCRHALDGNLSVLGESHASTLDDLDSLGLILISQGKYEEAEETFQRELRLSEIALGRQHQQTIIATSSLALASRCRGKYATAEALSRRAIQGLENLLGHEHLDTLTCCNELAVTLKEQNKFEEAEQLHRRALAGQKKMLDSKHPEVLSTTGDLALVLGAQGRQDEAEVMIRDLIIKKKIVLGSHHPDTLMAVSNLASILYLQGKGRNAAYLFRQTLQLRERILGQNHPAIFTNENDLAVVLTAQRKYKQAIILFRRALVGRQSILGPNHPDTLSTQNNVASTLTALHQYTEAETLLRDILSRTGNAADSIDGINADLADTAAISWNLADLLHRQERFDEAVLLYERACAEFAERPGQERDMCRARFRDMTREVELRKRGGIYSFDKVRALRGLGGRIAERIGLRRYLGRHTNAIERDEEVLS